MSWQRQSLKDDCALLAVADVVGEITGQEPTEQQMIELAETTPSQTTRGPIYVRPTDQSAGGGRGVEMADEVVLLRHFGIQSQLTDETHPDQTGLTGLDALKQYLADGRQVIAWLNSATIWGSDGQRTRADHFPVVTGIDNQIVHLNDSAIDHPDEQISLTTFATAWQTSRDAVLVTAPAS